MIPRVINAGSIMFVALRKQKIVASDHPNFDAIREYLISGGDDERHLLSLADVTFAVQESSEGLVRLNENGIYFDGNRISDEWAEKAVQDPKSLRVFTISVGDRVRVEGDEDAPDGVYVVGDVDNTDTGKRIYVESEEDYFGFVSNESIKEIIK